MHKFFFFTRSWRTALHTVFIDGRKCLSSIATFSYGGIITQKLRYEMGAISDKIYWISFMGRV